MIEVSLFDFEEMKKMASLVRELTAKGYNPATSGNYSLRSISNPGLIFVSESGIDKSKFTEGNFLSIDLETKQLTSDPSNLNRKSSDETGLHLAIYQSTNAGCVIHCHILESLLFADLYPGQKHIKISGLELLKAFKNVDKQDLRINIPCFENTQDIQRLAENTIAELKSTDSYCYLIRGHGIYVWGANITEAQKHLDVFEYIFRYCLKNK
jgi:methylthioribulose-1-phosphate dehydratase